MPNTRAWEAGRSHDGGGDIAIRMDKTMAHPECMRMNGGDDDILEAGGDIPRETCIHSLLRMPANTHWPSGNKKMAVDEGIQVDYLDSRTDKDRRKVLPDMGVTNWRWKPW